MTAICFIELCALEDAGRREVVFARRPETGSGGPREGSLSCACLLNVYFCGKWTKSLNENGFDNIDEIAGTRALSLG